MSIQGNTTDLSAYGLNLYNAGQAANLPAAALAYAEAGAYVFPLWNTAEVDGRRQCVCRLGADCKRPGKHPRTTGGLTDATRDPRLIAAWWSRRPLANIGIEAGRSGLAVLDIDAGGYDTYLRLADWIGARHGVQLGETLATLTPSGGLHLIYAAPPGNGIKTDSRTFGPDAPGVDTRGRGGYIVAPPSMGVSGLTYVHSAPSPLQPWHPELTRLMTPIRPAQQASGARRSNPTGYGAKALAAEAEKVRTEKSGHRNGTLFTAALKIGSLIGGGLVDEDTARDALTEAAREAFGNEEEPGEIARTIDAGMRRGKDNPRQPRPVAADSAGMRSSTSSR